MEHCSSPWIILELEVVGAHVDDAGQHPLGVEAPRGHVEVQLADADAEAANAEVPQPQHAGPVRHHHRVNLDTGVRQSTAGHEGSVGVISCMSIFSACFGLLTSVQLAATTWSGQIWISC